MHCQERIGIRSELTTVAKGLRAISRELSSSHLEDIAYDKLRDAGKLFGLPWACAFRDVFNLDNEESIAGADAVGLPAEFFERVRKRRFSLKSNPRAWSQCMPFATGLPVDSRRSPLDKDEKSINRQLMELGVESLLVIPLHKPMGTVGFIGWGGSVDCGVLSLVADQLSPELLDFGYRFMTHMDSVDAKGPSDVSLPHLTLQELKCLKLVANGLTFAEVSEQVGISTTTVRYHIDNCRAKFDAASVTHCVALAVQFGLLGIVGRGEDPVNE